MKKIYIFLILFTAGSFAAVWSQSYYSLIQSNINTLINTKMQYEYSQMQLLQEYYINNIQNLETQKEANRKKILQLENEELLLLQKIKQHEKNIKDIEK